MNKRVGEVPPKNTGKPCSLKTVIAVAGIFMSLYFWYAIGPEKQAVPERGKAVEERNDAFPLHQMGRPADTFAVALPALTAPLPLYSILNKVYFAGLYNSQRWINARKKYLTVNTYLRNAFYVHISIHAP